MQVSTALWAYAVALKQAVTSSRARRSRNSSPGPSSGGTRPVDQAVQPEYSPSIFLQVSAPEYGVNLTPKRFRSTCGSRDRRGGATRRRPARDVVRESMEHEGRGLIPNGAPATERPPALDARELRKHYGGIQALSGATSIVHGRDPRTPGRERRRQEHGREGRRRRRPTRRGRGTHQWPRLTLGSPSSRAAGVAVVYQELSLVPQFSVMHNLVLSDFPRAGACVHRSCRGDRRGGARPARMWDIDLRAPGLPASHSTSARWSRSRRPRWADPDPDPRRSDLVVGRRGGPAALRARARSARRRNDRRRDHTPDARGVGARRPHDHPSRRTYCRRFTTLARSASGSREPDGGQRCPRRFPPKPLGPATSLRSSFETFGCGAGSRRGV